MNEPTIVVVYSDNSLCIGAHLHAFDAKFFKRYKIPLNRPGGGDTLQRFQRPEPVIDGYKFRIFRQPMHKNHYIADTRLRLRDEKISARYSGLESLGHQQLWIMRKLARAFKVSTTTIRQTVFRRRNGRGQKK